MKRCWFGGALLILLLGLGLGVTWFMNRCHDPIARDLEQAALCAAESDWEQTAIYTARARSRWEQHRNFSAAFADHEPMEEIDRMFAELEVWQQLKDAEHCASICAQLSQSAQAIGDAHTLTWWNFL